MITRPLASLRGSALWAFLLVALILLYLFIRGRDPAPPAAEAPRKNPDSTPAPGAPHSTGNLDQPSLQPRPRKPAVDSDEQLIRIDNAAIAIVKSLQEDETRRAALLSKEDHADHVSFVFKIDRHPGLENLISVLCEKGARDAAVSPIALRAKLNDRIDEFLIPEGRIQKVFFEVPKDPAEPGFYVMTTCSPDDPPGKATVGSGAGNAGTMAGDHGWRYDKLVDLGEAGR